MTTADVLTDIGDMRALEASWELLYAQRANEPSTSFEWTAAMLRHHTGVGDRVACIRLSRGGDLVGLVPVIARSLKVLGLPVVTLAPLTDRYNTHSDLLATSLERDVLEAFFRALTTLDVRWDLFRLANVLESHPIVDYISAGPIPGRAMCRLRDGHASYYLTLPATYQDYLADRSAKFRNHLKRTEKRLEADPAVNIIEFSAPDEVDRAYDMLLQVERASWKHANGTAITAVPHQVGFYRDLCQRAAARARLHLQFLTMAGAPVAYNLGYVRQGTYSYLKTSYAEEFKHLGVATYLRARLIRTLIERGVRHMDFPAEPYEWERQWTQQVRWHKVLTVYRNTPAGCALALIDTMRARVRSRRAVAHVDPRRIAVMKRPA